VLLPYVCLQKIAQTSQKGAEKQATFHKLFDVPKDEVLMHGRACFA